MKNPFLVLIASFNMDAWHGFLGYQAWVYCPFKDVNPSPPHDHAGEYSSMTTMTTIACVGRGGGEGRAWNIQIES